MSYSAAVKSLTTPDRLNAGDASQESAPHIRKIPGSQQPPEKSSRRTRSASPSHQPQTVSSDESVYILTFITDCVHHDRMTALRTKYFPQQLNKLDAHLTLFHALPESRLESSILPVVRKVASQTRCFRFNVRTPGRMGKRGIGVFVPRGMGGDEMRDVHHALLENWKEEGWLSTQDSGSGMKPHYTIMNKVDDEKEVEKAFDEIKDTFHGCEGMVEGLGLWRYDRGWWRKAGDFRFADDGD